MLVHYVGSEKCVMPCIHHRSIIYISFTNLKILSRTPFQSKSAQFLWGCCLVNPKATSITEAIFFPFAFTGRLPAVYLWTNKTWWLWPLFHNSSVSQHIQFHVLPPVLITSKLNRLKSSQKLLFIKVKVETRCPRRCCPTQQLAVQPHPSLPPKSWRNSYG